LGVRNGVSDSAGVVSFDVTAAVQAWVSGAENHGLIVEAMPNNVLEICSSEHPVPEFRPTLTVRLHEKGD
jgi:hypothetical protein